MGLPSPIYHQHVDDRHPRPSRHIDNITLYPSGVYSGILQKGLDSPVKKRKNLVGPVKLGMIE